ncbi:MAG: Cys-tRNA(Pro) deacylase [Acidimicrobiales bacterium]|nr:Cys-tRNA(Pro) deacylase [Acidimicrobiales bacterium]RZV48556.1 MAG: Cys-tRNA(Pro) deacylase [Acidimicrobiales bacterium]
MTPACSALDRAGICYTIHTYDHDDAAESFGVEAAELLKLDPKIVFKTLMASLDDDELVVAIVPVTGTLQLKRLARAAGSKRATMADPGRAQRSSGYVIGGISPFGQRTPKRTFLDDSAASLETIFVSGGRRGLDIEIAPADLIRELDATVCTIRG